MVMVLCGKFQKPYERGLLGNVPQNLKNTNLIKPYKFRTALPFSRVQINIVFNT